ncbi:hypothetical protein D3C78_1874660 [compost metagenome]
MKLSLRLTKSWTSGGTNICTLTGSRGLAWKSTLASMFQTLSVSASVTGMPRTKIW